MNDSDTITAIATPLGKGGIGIIRISGNGALDILRTLSGIDSYSERRAVYCSFLDDKKEIIDTGLAIYFPAPRSFTGEDVVELQVHGSPFLLNILIDRTMQLGARLAGPGEFSYRSYKNNKIDLAQAEAIADLIGSGSEAAARLASRSLQGLFSKKIGALKTGIIKVRVYIEATFDFSEEEIDDFSSDFIKSELQDLIYIEQEIMEAAKVGAVMRDGLSLVIAGNPNVGKSSLLNILTSKDSAIVTEIPGTTRDILKEYLELDGIPLHVIDTAGFRNTDDPIELIGIEKAIKAIETADHILWLVDDSSDIHYESGLELPKDIPCTAVRNKIDLTGTSGGMRRIDGLTEISISAKTGDGIEDLKNHIKHTAGLQENQQGEFIARKRHLVSLGNTQKRLATAMQGLDAGSGMEFIAEELRLAQNHLSEITGEFTSDDLLGEIFSTFCIGK